MQKFSGSNSGYNYILVVIDCFSKKLWTRPLKTKRGQETAQALRSILESMKYPVQTMIFDEGLEYVNQYVSNLLNVFQNRSSYCLVEYGKIPYRTGGTFDFFSFGVCTVQHML